MHRSLNGLPERVVVDTNVLLDATFVGDGLARRALVTLPKLGYSPIIDKSIEGEAHNVLDRLKARLQLRFKPDTGLSQFIGALAIPVWTQAPAYRSSKVNRADRHVVGAASHYNAWVLTGDASLTVECGHVGIEARAPWDVLMEEVERAGTYPQLNHLIRINAPTAWQGLLFARATPGNWKGGKAGQFTICEIENVGRLYYDLEGAAWTFSMRNGAEVRVHHPITKIERWAVCGSYHLPGGNRDGKAMIQAGTCPSTLRTRVTDKISGMLSGQSAGKIVIGRDISGQCYWNSTIADLVIGPQGMSRKKFKAIVQVPNSAPNPYDTDALERALRILQTKLDAGVRASVAEADLRSAPLK